MGSFFGQDGKDDESENPSLQAPVSQGVTYREQFAQPTGGASGGGTGGDAGGGTGGGQPAAAPGSAAPASTPGGGRAGRVPQFTNLHTFLSGQSDSQVDSEANHVTDKAAQLSGAATQAGNAAAEGASNAAKAGIDTGSVGVFTPAPPPPPSAPAPAPAPAPPAPAPQGLRNQATRAAAIISGKDPDPAQASTAPPVPTSVDVAQAPSYDLSKVNLSGYAGPDANHTQAGFNAANSTARAASDNAKLLSTGSPTANAFDNAVLTQTPAWGKIQGAIAGENQAAANVGAQTQGAVEGVNQAKTASGTNVAQQRADLGLAQDTLSANSAATASAAQHVGNDLSTATPESLSDALASPETLKALGLTADQLKPLIEGLRSGSLVSSEVAKLLAPYIAAAKGSTGYGTAGADQANQINTLLKNGAGPVSASAAGTGSTDTSAQTAANSTSLKTLNANEPALRAFAEYMKNLGSRGFSGWGDPGLGRTLTNDEVTQKAQSYARTIQQSKAAISQLIDAGYTREQIEQLAGITDANYNEINNYKG